MMNKANTLERRTARRGLPEVLEVDSLTLTVITDNYYDAVRPDPPLGKRYRAVPNVSVHAEHGLSYFMEAVANGRLSSFMFDFGLDPWGVMNNMRLLGVDAGRVSAFGLSHGHFDHFGGLLEIIRQYRPRIRKGAPLFVGEDACAHRFHLRPSGGDMVDLKWLNAQEISQLSCVEIMEIRQPTEAVPGIYLTGPIERVTDYEEIPSELLIEKGDKIEQDDFKGELALVCAVRGKGLVVVSGCAHRGIVNTVKQAQRITGIEKVHAIIGGFHLVNTASEIIEKTIAGIKMIAPDYIIPTHCTGFEALTAFSREMSKEFILNTAGTRYVFSA